MQSQIKISVIVPVYNVAPYLHQCLETLVNQSLKEIEIIVINDASTDESGSICDEWASRDNRIRIIHHSMNQKQGRTRNNGIQLAKGEYIGFVDPDDWVDLDFFGKLYSKAKEHGADIVKASLARTNENGAFISKSTHNRQIYKGFKRGDPIFLFFTQEHTTAIYRRQWLESNKVRYAEINVGEDNIFLLQAGYFTQTMAILKDTYYYYRCRSNSSTENKSQEFYESSLHFFDAYVNFINTHYLPEKIYHKAFQGCVQIMRLRYIELLKNSDLKYYSVKFLQELFLISTKFKYNHRFLMDHFFAEESLKAQIKYLILKILSRIKQTLIEINPFFFFRFKNSLHVQEGFADKNLKN
jgi:glycosyltransferase involved in cell wall biosynthesis